MTADDTVTAKLAEWEALTEDYCGRDSCWLEPGHEGECRPGGCGHAGRGA